MVNMEITNKKLQDRGTRMILDELGIDYRQANALLSRYGSVQKAINAYKEADKK